MIPGTIEVKIRILAMAAWEDGFIYEYEVVEDTGNFKKGQREHSPLLRKEWEDLAWKCLENPERLHGILAFDKEGNVAGFRTRVRALHVLRYAPIGDNRRAICTK